MKLWIKIVITLAAIIATIALLFPFYPIINIVVPIPLVLFVLATAFVFVLWYGIKALITACGIEGLGV